MAQVRAIFQPLIPDNLHVDRLVGLAAEPWLTSLTLSSAFANSAGVAAVSAALVPIADRCRAFIGVRNGSTTAQSLAALLALGVEVYGVDTAMRARIFHPKLYLAIGQDRARAIIGSANLTHAGLYNNLEAGADVSLDLGNPSDEVFTTHFRNELQRLIDDFPEHCFPITSGRQLISLMNQGLLEDERMPRTETALGAGKQGAQTSKAQIDLPFTATPKGKGARKPKPPQPLPGTAMSVVPHYGQLVWAKPNLPSGDLQLLQAGHASGVLRLTQAQYEVNGQHIDQTTYFRNEVFSQLPWAVDQVANKEVAVVQASLVIASVYVGDFNLQLSHKPAWEANQGNYTTALHCTGGNRPSISESPGLSGARYACMSPPRRAAVT